MTVSSRAVGDALISALVLNFDLSQQQRGVSSGDLIPEQRRSASEALVLLVLLVLLTRLVLLVLLTLLTLLTRLALIAVK